jgi:hypothetical protein
LAEQFFFPQEHLSIKTSLMSLTPCNFIVVVVVVVVVVIIIIIIKNKRRTPSLCSL